MSLMRRSSNPHCTQKSVEPEPLASLSWYQHISHDNRWKTVCFYNNKNTLLITFPMAVLYMARHASVSLNIHLDQVRLEITSDWSCQVSMSLSRTQEHFVGAVWSLRYHSVFVKLLSGDYLWGEWLPWAASTISLLRGRSGACLQTQRNSE